MLDFADEIFSGEGNKSIYFIFQNKSLVNNKTARESLDIVGSAKYSSTHIAECRPIKILFKNTYADTAALPIVIFTCPI
jgi:hypothetical protein